MNNNENKPTKNNFKLKNLIWIIPFVILILIIVAVNVGGIIDVFSGFIKTAKNIGNGNLILGLCLLPFAIWGAVQIFRGFCEMGDAGKIDSAWQMISTILGFVALFISIKNI